MAIPETQQAWRIHRRGRPRDVLALDEIPVPKPKPGQALVKVEAAALNPVGYKMMAIGISPIFKLPRTAEHDFAGTVIDANDTSFKNGDKIWGFMALQKDDQGALAQYIAATEDQIALRPSNLSLQQAAGLGCVGVTAEKCIFQDAKVQPGQAVLVVGGSSSLGGVVIQMLKAIGCTVHASCSGKNIVLVKKVGANKVYDYTVKPLPQQLLEDPPSPKFDAIIDCVGGYDLFRLSEAYLARHGTYVSPGSSMHSLRDLPSEIVGAFNAYLRPTWLGGTNRRFLYTLGLPSKKALAAVNKIVQGGSVAPAVDSEFDFADALDAYDRIMTGRATGKIVVRVL